MRQKLQTLGVIALCLVVAGSSWLQSANTPYYAAIRANDLTRLQEAVVASGVDAADEQGQSPLMHAASVGTLEAVRLLIERGANVNATDRAGVTPLMFGARDLAKVRLLLEKGADPAVKSRIGQTALLVAAAKPGSIDIVRALVEKGADPRVVGAAGRTGVTVAALAGDLETVRFFVDRGVDVNASFRSDKAGNTPLMLASAQLNAPMARLLLQNGADVNAATTDPGVGRNGVVGMGGYTPLMMAAPYGSPELVRTLLAAGANPNARDNRGMTPLMWAVASENQDAEVVKLLLAARSDPAVKSDAGETALDWARKYATPATVALLSGGKDIGRPLATPVSAGTASLPPAGELRTMLQESTALLQSSSKQFGTKGGCLGCHHQYLTGAAIAAARSRGVPFDEKLSSELWQLIEGNLSTFQNSATQRLDGGGLYGITTYTLFALQAAGHPADAATDAAVVYLLARQRTDGRWPRDDVSRSPLDDGHINRTALSVAAIEAYAPPSLKGEADEHLRRARQWLMNARPATTDDQAMLLFGLRHSGGSPKEVQAAAKGLLALQRGDGGWAPRPYLPSDAYATSQALWVLSDTRTLPVTDAGYRRGLQFLVKTRAKDGSWHVASRAPKFQPYFESGFPYGHDQWISAAATARAVVVLAGSLGEGTNRLARR